MSLISEIYLVDIIGSPTEADGIIFVPARFDFASGLEGEIECWLNELPLALGQLENQIPSDDYSIEHLLPYWVRARIPRVFHFNPGLRVDVTDGEMQDLPFVAVIQDESVSTRLFVPFICEEGMYGPGLAFCFSNRHEVLKQRVAAAFWGALLAQPAETEDYEEIVETQDGWGQVIFKHNRLFQYDLELVLVGWEPDTHLTRLPDEGFRCPDCDGDGIEDLFPYTEDCATCGGTGSVTW